MYECTRVDIHNCVWCEVTDLHCSLDMTRMLKCTSAAWVCVRRCALANAILQRNLHDGLIYLWSRFIFWLAYLLLCSGRRGFVGPELCKPNEYACWAAVSKALKPSLAVTAYISIPSGLAWPASNPSTRVRLNQSHQYLLNMDTSSSKPANAPHALGVKSPEF